jgi:hypothetical protein
LPGDKLFIDARESRFEDITDWLPRAALELNESQLFDRPKIPRSGADFDPGQKNGALVVFESRCLLHNVLTRQVIAALFEHLH